MSSKYAKYTSLALEERVRTSMIIPVAEGTYFNTNWKPKKGPLCAYDMLYHPPDYNPRAARSDRQQPEIIRQNIWDQEFHKGIPSTSHFVYGRPKWRIHDYTCRMAARKQVKNENPHMRIHNILEWAELINEGKPTLCE